MITHTCSAAISSALISRGLKCDPKCKDLRFESGVDPAFHGSRFQLLLPESFP